jgi:hypothetical protein
MEEELHAYLDDFIGEHLVAWEQQNNCMLWDSYNDMLTDDQKTWLRENITSVFHNFAFVVRQHREAENREIVEIIVKNLSKGVDRASYDLKTFYNTIQ